MTDWIEPVSKEQANATKQLPAIPFTWIATDVPRVPVTLPISAMLKVGAEGILVHAKRDKAGFRPPEEANLQLLKQEIICVEIC